MNNYKIRVNNEAESREAQELFFELGYVWNGGIGKSQIKPKYNEYYLFAKDGLITYCDLSEVELNCVGCSLPELTLPQLRDLVVLHRNDINDANWETEGGDQIYIDSSGKSFIFRKQGWDELQRHEMRQAMWEKIKPKPQLNQYEQGLISGAEAKLAWANGEDVQFRDEFDKWYQDWTDLEGKKNGFWITDFDLPNHQFRLKPRTVKLEIEVPAPFEPKDGDECFILSSDSEDGFYRFVYEENSGFHKNLIQFGVWRTVADIKIVVDQLRKLKEQSK